MREGWTHWRGVVGGTLVGTLVVMLGIVASSESALGAVPGFDGKIAFASSREGNGEIYVMNVDGSGQVNLTNRPDDEDFDPVWSPDGRSIAFVREGHIYVMGADGSDPLNIGGLAPAYAPAWSPDGRRIAFVREGDIYVMDVDGSDHVRLTREPGLDDGPTWSPDGGRIAFVRNLDIYVMNADGSEPINLTPGSDRDYSPDWSPDGSRIAFVRDPDDDREATDADIHVMNSDGSNRRVVFGDEGEDWSPSWSPDGSKIVFTRDPPGLGGWSVVVVNVDGSGLRYLGQGLSPAWQPVPSADLGVSLGTAPSTAKRGKPLTYSITVQNSGPSNALDVTVVDQLPAEVRFVSARTSRGSCQTPETGAAGTVRCDIGFLPTSGRVSAEIEVTVVVRKGTFRNTVYVTSSTPDPFGSNNAATAVTQVR